MLFRSPPWRRFYFALLPLQRPQERRLLSGWDGCRQYTPQSGGTRPPALRNRETETGSAELGWSCFGWSGTGPGRIRWGKIGGVCHEPCSFSPAPGPAGGRPGAPRCAAWKRRLSRSAGRSPALSLAGGYSAGHAGRRAAAGDQPTGNRTVGIFCF